MEKAYLDLWKPQIAAARSLGKEFVVGEYSSVSCSGKENVTDTFGQALWLADSACDGVSRDLSTFMTSVRLQRFSMAHL
jgi:hypothetical protein